MEFEAVEGDHEYLAELRHGRLCSLLANINRNPKVKAQPFEHEEFMLNMYRKPERELTPEELDRMLGGILGA